MTKHLITFEDDELGCTQWLKVTCDKLKANLSDRVVHADGVRIEVCGEISNIEEIED